VSARYVLLSVPNDENLQLRMMKCPRCRTISHIYDHQQSFDPERLGSLFEHFQTIDCVLCGSLQPPDYPDWLLRLRQNQLDVFWYVNSSYFPMCPACGNTDYIDKRIRTFVYRVLTTLAYRLLTLRAARKPNWIVMLLERTVRLSQTAHG
jgi:predicted nucleic-acid-binding Zn-ribbon protein